MGARDGDLSCLQTHITRDIQSRVCAYYKYTKSFGNPTVSPHTGPPLLPVVVFNLPNNRRHNGPAVTASGYGIFLMKRSPALLLNTHTHSHTHTHTHTHTQYITPSANLSPSLWRIILNSPFL